MNNTFTLNLLEIPVYYINLDKDKEKAQSLELLLKQLGFKNINRFSGVLEEPKRNGVAKSHKKILENIADKDFPVLILEDDVDIASFKSTIEIPNDADAYYLGNSAWGLYGSRGSLQVSKSHFDKDIYKIHNMLAAHAILYLNKEYVDFLIKAIDFNITIKTNQDKARAQTMKYFNIYASDSPTFFQKGRHEKFTKINLSALKNFGPERAFG